MKRSFLLIAWILLSFAFTVSAADGDWPQLGHDGGRSGATGARLRAPFERKWYRLFADEGVQAGVQPVVAGGRVYIATLRGVLHAMDAETGRDVWTYKGEGPAMHSAAVEGERVFVGIGDSLHAVNVADGSRAWVFRTAVTVWNAPAVHAGVVYFGSRDGWVHALDAATGEVRWSAEVAAPLLQSVAVDAARGRVVVGAEDMRVRAFEVGTGRVVWVSEKVPGVSFRGYHPVVARDGSVMVTVTPCAGGDAMQQVLLDMAKEVFGEFASWRIKSEAEKKRIRAENFELMKRPETYRRQMDYLRKRLTEEPALQTFFVLDGETGKQKFVPPVVYAESMNGPGSPAVVTPDGKVIVKYGFLSRSRYEHYSPFLNVGYLDTATGDVTPVMDEKRTYGWHDSLLLVHDEQSQLVVAGGTLINTHQDNVNALDLRTLRGDERPWANGVHEVKPGVGASLAARVAHGKELPRGWEWLGRGTAVYGGGSAIDVPVVVAGDSFYFLPTHELNAGVALVAYRMDPAGRAHEKVEEKAVMGERFSPEEVKGLRWDWDTLEAERLKGTLAGLAVPEGTRGRPRTEAGREAAARITDDRLDAVILGEGAATESRARAALRGRLDAAVEELVSEDWRPLLFPGAKHPAEAYWLFSDPAGTLYTLALAYPHLSPAVREKVRARVETMRGGVLERETYDPNVGRVRSAYDEAPASLLKMGRERVRSKGARVYAKYLWARNSGEWAWLQRHWPRVRPVLEAEVGKAGAGADNDRLSTAIAFARLAKRLDGAGHAAEALAAARGVVRGRVAYELSHTEGGVIAVEGLRSVVGRWHRLDPDSGAVLGAFAREVNAHLMEVYVDHHRPAWHVAWNVELLWRNEAPFSFPDLSADVFAARGLVLGEKGEELEAFLDVPWCKGDEYYIQKLAIRCGAR